MKFKTTRKEMLNQCACQCVPCGMLDNLLRFEDALAYTTGIYGWNANIYVYPSRPLAVVTGYRTFGKMYFKLDELKAWNEKAIESSKNADTVLQEREAVSKILQAFWNEFANRI